MLRSFEFHPINTVRNFSLILLSVAFLPIDTLVVCWSLIYAKVCKPTVIKRRERIRQDPSFRPRKILVTGVGMTKGLMLARSFYKAGHDVIGADFEPDGELVSGRVSKALSRFYALPQPDAGNERDIYVESLKAVIQSEQVELWISCSGVVSAVDDGRAKEVIEMDTTCRAIQFNEQTTKLFHEKDSFIDYLNSVELPTPETHKILDIHTAQRILENASDKKQFIMKPIGVDDANRADMTLLSKATLQHTKEHLDRLDITEEKPWILQQFIRGEEYCTHALVVHGQVRAFVACRSTELLMHYEALQTASHVNSALLDFTQKIAAFGGQNFTGHLSFDFLLEANPLESVDANGGKAFNLYPIECNPRCHTAVILFARDFEALSKVYLSAFEPGAAKDDPSPALLLPEARDRYYWLGHDLVTQLLLPILRLCLQQETLKEFRSRLAKSVTRLALWSDGTFELFDPWPWWWLYHFYWPMKFINSIWHSQKWSRINVSTTKMFHY